MFGYVSQGGQEGVGRFIFTPQGLIFRHSPPLAYYNALLNHAVLGRGPPPTIRSQIAMRRFYITRIFPFWNLKLQGDKIYLVPLILSSFFYPHLRADQVEGKNIVFCGLRPGPLVLKSLAKHNRAVTVC